jgi:AraC-like DNA-binding protein
VPAFILQVGAAGYLWLFFVALFEDRRLRLADALVPVAITAAAIAGYYSEQPARRLLWTAHHLLQLAAMGHLLLVVMRSWRGDLVEARRRLRGPLAAAVAFYTLAITSMNLSVTLGYATPYPGLLISAALAALGIACAFVFLDARTVLFGATRAEAERTAEAQPVIDRPTLARLDRLMREDKIWRREGLTIGALADAVGAPEHRLRRLINDDLGHRNFAAFVNERRIAAAKQALGDADRARVTVASIAYDLGFGSLGPFNRAFREATGITPTEYRRRALGETSPNPEMAG